MSFLNLNRSLLQECFQPFFNPVRNRYYWADWRMLKDVNKRKILTENAVQKVRINALRKNKILPKEIREIADKEITELPRDAVGLRIVMRCGITSRPRGNILRWRISRIVFRDLADYNKLSGIQRAIW